MVLKDLLLENQENTNVAVIDRDVEYTYKWIYEKAKMHSLNLLKYDGDNIGLFIDNSIDYVIGYFSIVFAGKIIVPIENNAKEETIVSIIDYCNIQNVVTNEMNYDYIKRILSINRKTNITMYRLDLKDSDEIKMVQEQDPVEIKEDNVAIMLHTSGTTSNPKKVMLTHKNLISNIKANVASLGLNSNDRCLIVLPMCFGYCNTSQFLTHFYLGGSIVIYDGVFVPVRFFHYIEKYGCTNTTCIPTMLYLITKSKKSNYSLKSLRYLCFGGGTISLDVLKNVSKWLPDVGIVQTYGQTEASPRITCLLPQDSERKIGSVGRPIPGVCVKVVDEDGKELPANSRGEIVVKGDNVMKGYYKRTEETAKVIRNGWLHTGDIGIFDDEGYLYVVGRIKNVIITGGLNVYPEEIEEILRSHSDVEEALVFPRRHEVLGEVPIAQVVVKKNTQVSTSQLLSFCRKRLEIQKIPSEIIVVEKIEKTYNGKVRRVSCYDNK